MSSPRPVPPLPDGASPELVAMNEALWAWVNTGSFEVKAALMQCLHEHDEQARIINRYIGDIARAWGLYLETLSCGEFEQQCERCGDPFEAAEESSLCPKCEAS